SEAAAAQELVRRGHRIVARNWKTKYCEIDIVSCKNDIYYFSEVKHRRTTVQGNGFDAITSQKLRQMHYAARFYAHVKNLRDTDMRLLAIATTGNNYSVVDVSVVE
ncbi:MAG: YraN family protein, partial [Candidatus Saccharimonas sp.]